MNVLFQKMPLRVIAMAFRVFELKPLLIQSKITLEFCPIAKYC